MSRENVEGVRSVYESLNRGDWEGVFRDAHPDLGLSTQQGPAAGTYRGHEAVREQVEELTGPFGAWAMEPQKFFDGEDDVVAFVKVRSRPKGSSVDMEVRNGQLWTTCDGSIRSLKTFAIREEALPAAGLRE